MTRSNADTPQAFYYKLLINVKNLGDHRVLPTACELWFPPRAGTLLINIIFALEVRKKYNKYIQKLMLNRHFITRCHYQDVHRIHENRYA
jgi:hypothetical protein